METLEARVQHLEAELEGLQDAVYRRAVLEDAHIDELRTRTSARAAGAGPQPGRSQARAVMAGSPRIERLLPPRALTEARAGQRPGCSANGSNVASAGRSADVQCMRSLTRPW